MRFGYGLIAGRVTSAAPPPPAPWLPTDLAGLLAWFDAQDAGTLTLAGASLTAWADKSGNGFDLARRALGGEPQYSATSFPGSLPGLTFDGVDDGLLNGTLSGIAAGTPLQAFAVAKPTATGNYDRIASVTDATADSVAPDYIPLLRNAATASWSAYSDGILSVAALPDGTAGVLGSVVEATTHQAFVDGNAGASVAFAYPGGFTPTRLALGCQGDGSISGDAYAGTIGEVVLVAGAITLLERQKLEGYLVHSWGLAGNLPGGHPYAGSPP